MTIASYSDLAFLPTNGQSTDWMYLVKVNLGHPWLNFNSKQVNWGGHKAAPPPWLGRDGVWGLLLLVLAFTKYCDNRACVEMSEMSVVV